VLSQGKKKKKKKKAPAAELSLSDAIVIAAGRKPPRDVRLHCGEDHDDDDECKGVQSVE
jgi:hypothetical protein